MQFITGCRVCGRGVRCVSLKAARRMDRLWEAQSAILRRGVPGRSANRRLNELQRRLEQAHRLMHRAHVRAA